MKENTGNLKRKLQRRLKKLGQTEPFISGTLVKIERRCGNPNCRCAREGKKHPAHLLTSKVEGKTQSIYVPVDMVEEVRQWCRQYQILKSNIKDVSECCEQLIRLHAKGKKKKPEKRNLPKEQAS